MLFTLLALSLGARIVRNDATLDLDASPPVTSPPTPTPVTSPPTPTPVTTPPGSPAHDSTAHEVTTDAVEIAKLAKDAVEDVDLVVDGDFSKADMAQIVKQVATDAKMVKGIVHDVFGKGGLLSRAKQALKAIKDKRKDFCWWKIAKRPTTDGPEEEERTSTCYESFCNLFRKHKPYAQCPAGTEKFHLDKGYCHTTCSGDLPKRCGLGCAKNGLGCAKAIEADVEAPVRAILSALALIFPNPVTVGVDVGVSATLDSLHLVAKAVMAGVDDKDAHVKEAKFAAAMLAVLHHAGDPKNWAELKSSAVAVKDDVHVKEYAKRAFTKFKESMKDAKSVVKLVYTGLHDSTVLSSLGKVALADTVASGLLTVQSVMEAFVAPTCAQSASVQPAAALAAQPAEPGPARETMERGTQPAERKTTTHWYDSYHA